MPSTSNRALNRIELQVDLNYEVGAPGGDFVFNVHAAHTPSQRLSAESLMLTPAVESQTHTDPATRNRYLRMHVAPGPLALSYGVSVDLMHRIGPGFRALAVEDEAQGLVRPYHCADALSTDSGPPPAPGN